MIIVEKGVGREPASRTLQSMFEDRKSVFVDLLKWDVPTLDGRFEMDGFDDRHAIYLIVADPRGDHLGSARLLRTTRPGILTSLFPDLCASPPPSGEQVLEITRFCLSRRQNGAARLRVRNLLVSALVDFALDHAIHTYTGVAEVGWLQQILAFGWDCRPLGPPVRRECGIIGALAIEVDGRTPGLLAANGIWQTPEPAPRIAEAA